MKVSNTLFYIFAIVFFAFALAFLSFMNNEMTGEEGGSRFLLMRIVLLLDLVCFGALFVGINRNYRGIHLVSLLWVLIMPIVMYINHCPLADTVRTILWPLLFETTYLCCQARESRCLFLKKEYIVLAIIGFGYFLLTRIGADHQTNTIYLCFLTLPWLMFRTEKKTMLLLVFLFTFISLLSLKRSVMLAMVLMWAFYFIFGMKSRKNKVYIIIISIVVLGGLYLTFDKIDALTGGMLSERVNKEETDTGKSREAIWAVTTDMILTSSTEELITGHGHFGVRQNSWLEISAHNDFLEVIYDYGLVIFFLYLCLWVYVLRRAYYLYKNKSELFLPYAASLSIFLVMSMVSHLILYTTYFNYLVMFWGMTEAILEAQNQEFKRKAIKR